MTKYILNFSTTISLSVRVTAEDEMDASDAAWEYAEAYLQTLIGDGDHVFAVDATLDGQAEDSITEAGSDAAGGRS